MWTTPSTIPGLIQEIQEVVVRAQRVALLHRLVVLKRRLDEQKIDSSKIFTKDVLDALKGAPNV